MMGSLCLWSRTLWYSATAIMNASFHSREAGIALDIGVPSISCYMTALLLALPRTGAKVCSCFMDLTGAIKMNEIECFESMHGTIFQS